MEREIEADKLQGKFCEGPRLRLRRAGERDLDYIMELEFAPENLKYIVPFDRDFHTGLLTGKGALDAIVETLAGESVGYMTISGLTTEAREIEWTHVLIGAKGRGYGHETMKLAKKWAFETLGFHRAWLDCKDYNARALHLYEAEGMVREGLIRETDHCCGLNGLTVGLPDAGNEATGHHYRRRMVCLCFLADTLDF